MFFRANILSQSLLQHSLVIAQDPGLPPESAQDDSLIAYGAEYLIEIGVILIVITIVLIAGMLSKQVGKSILLALGLSAALIVILLNV